MSISLMKRRTPKAARGMAIIKLVLVLELFICQATAFANAVTAVFTDYYNNFLLRSMIYSVVFIALYCQISKLDS